jgi:hypothetical protein
MVHIQRLAIIVTKKFEQEYLKKFSYEYKDYSCMLTYSEFG